MAAPDPKWLEILKASGGQAFALAVTCGLFLLAATRGWFKAEDWMIAGASFLGILGAMLAVVSGITALNRMLRPEHHVKRRLSLRAHRKQLREYIPHMTEKERQIIGHLLHHNQKSFTAASDGGHASTLIARDFIVIAAQRGQVVDMLRVPMKVPDHIWDELIKHKDQFPYKPDLVDGRPIGPWHERWR